MIETTRERYRAARPTFLQPIPHQEKRSPKIRMRIRRLLPRMKRRSLHLPPPTRLLLMNQRPLRRRPWQRRAVPPHHLEMDEKQPCLEEDGFLIVDFTQAKIVARFFRWSRSLPDSTIDQLQPFRESEFPRRT